MIVVRLALTDSEGKRTEDFASGNTPATAKAAARALARSYEHDGYSVTVQPGTHTA